MTGRDRPIYRAIFFFVLAPAAAAVLISTLLLFGADPHVVFLAGHTVKSWLAAWGFRAPNAVGVLTTVFVWWAVIAAAGLWWERRRRRPLS